MGAKRSGASPSTSVQLLPFRQRFFRPSTDLRRLMVLRLLSDSPSLSQAKIGKACGLTPAIINRYIETLHSEGLIRVEPVNGRDLRYELTGKGHELSGFLLDEYSAEVSRTYAFMRSILEERLRALLDGADARVAVFGAGATSEILIMALTQVPQAQLVAIVDSDPKKLGKPLLTYMVSSPAILSAVQPDVIIVASWGMKHQILETIESLALPSGIKVATL